MQWLDWGSGWHLRTRSMPTSTRPVHTIPAPPRPQPPPWCPPSATTCPRDTCERKYGGWGMGDATVHARTRTWGSLASQAAYRRQHRGSSPRPSAHCWSVPRSQAQSLAPSKRCFPALELRSLWALVWTRSTETTCSQQNLSGRNDANIEERKTDRQIEIDR